MLRDAVEIVAILLAGTWAVYVFVYENRILPSLAQPSVVFTVSMQHVGDNQGLAVVRLDQSIRNAGTVRAHFAGYSLTVFGSRVSLERALQPARETATSSQLRAFYKFSREVPIYRNAYVTDLGHPGTGADESLEPGDTLSSSAMIYVPLGRFDHLRAIVDAIYTKHDDQILPTVMTIDRSGWTHFTISGISANERSHVELELADLDLKARSL